MKPRRRTIHGLAAIGASAFVAASSLSSCEQPVDVAAVTRKIARAECAAMADHCPCYSRTPLTEDECEGRAVSGELAALLATGRARGLEVDDACLDAYASLVAKRTCLSVHEPWPIACEDYAPCMLMPGSLSEGDSCETSDNGVFSDCGQGLTCDANARTCRPICTPPPGEGEPCATDAPEFCAPGLSCVGSSCAKLAAEGESCAQLPCVVGTTCDATFTCVALVPIGESCALDDDCLSAHCSIGLCAPTEAGVCQFD